MKFVPTPLADLMVIELEPIADHRGSFARAWCAREFAEHGIQGEFVQANLATTAQQGTLRGMHYQLAPHGEAKLMLCVRGAMFDHVVDLREGSETFGQTFGIELSADNAKMLYVPEGFAHGYLTLTDNCQAFYQVSAYYAPGAERGLRYNDPQFDWQWPEAVQVISDKDAQWPDFAG